MSGMQYNMGKSTRNVCKKPARRKNTNFVPSHWEGLKHERRGSTKPQGTTFVQMGEKMIKEKEAEKGP